MSDKFIAVRDDGSVYLEDSRAAIAQALRLGRTDITFYGIEVDPDTSVPTLRGPVELSPGAPVQVRAIELVSLQGGGSNLGSAEVEEVVTPATPEHPIPVIEHLAPDSSFISEPMGALIVHGSGFVQQSVVRVNGVEVATTLLPSGNELEATLPDLNTLGPGLVAISVFNPPPAGGASGSLDFAISPVNPVPVLTSLSQYTAPAATSALGEVSLVVTGADFMTQSKIRVDGVELNTAYVSETQLSAVLTQDILLTPGVLTIDVISQGPGGGVSSALNFTVA